MSFNRESPSTTSPVYSFASSLHLAPTDMTEDVRITPPLELHTPWKPSSNGKPKAFTPPSDHSRTSSDAGHTAIRTSQDPSPPRDKTVADSTGIDDAPFIRVIDTAPDAPPRIERKPTPIQRRVPSVVSAMSCSMCSATGVNSLWRRDRAGKPICGKCCEQLRRRMNPRYAVSSRGEMPSAPRAPAQTMSVRRQTPSPNGRPAPYPARSPIPGGYQASPYRSNELLPAPGNARSNGDRSADHAYLERGQKYDNTRHESGNNLTLPPLSSIERVADHYRRDPSNRIKEPVSLPAAPSAYDRPKHLLPSSMSQDRRAPSVNGERSQERRGVVTEADIQRKRAQLIEARAGIFLLLDETTAMLRQIDSASLHANATE